MIPCALLKQAGVIVIDRIPRLPFGFWETCYFWLRVKVWRLRRRIWSFENERPPHCLRCPEVQLRELPESSPEIAFFDCPSCLRHYARQRGRALTYRWGHPVSLALYGSFKFPPAVHDYSPEVAEDLLGGRSQEEITRIVGEIELELEQPTQQVRDILDTPASEKQCRAFLAAVVRHMIWYSSYLRALNEPYLKEMSMKNLLLEIKNAAPDLRGSAGSEFHVYRFFLFSTLRQSVAVRVTVRKDDTAELVSKVLSVGVPAGFPGRLLMEQTRDLSKEDTQAFLGQLESIDLWNLAAHDGRVRLDGETWILEAVKGDMYHRVERWSPEGTALGSLCEYLMADLAKLQLPCAEPTEIRLEREHLIQELQEVSDHQETEREASLREHSEASETLAERLGRERARMRRPDG